MGWFSIAVIVGFLLFWSWRDHLRKPPAVPEDSYLKRFSSSIARDAHLVFIDFLPAILVGLLILTAPLFFLGKAFVRFDTFNTALLEEIRRGYITRSVLGLILGFGVGYILEQRSRPAEGEASKPAADGSGAPPGDKAGSPSPSVETGNPTPAAETASPVIPAVGDASPPGGAGAAAAHDADAANANRTNGDKQTLEEAPSALSSLARLSTSALLSIGIGIFVLALASPHLDSWLNHITRIKLPYGELTVATSTTHRTINSDALRYLIDALSLTELSRYNARLRQDIQYIEKFEIPDLQLKLEVDRKSSSSLAQDLFDAEKKLDDRKNALRKTKDLSKYFDEVISPIAQCVVEAIDHGLSLESVRQKLRPATDQLEKIVLLREHLPPNKRNDAHEEFWKVIKGLPAEVEPFLYLDDAEAKKKLPRDRKAECKSYADKVGEPKDLPKFEDYSSVPYLGVAAFLFSAFVRDEELAQKILEKTGTGLNYKDKEFLYFQSYIGYYKSLPTDTIVEYLEELLKDARDHKLVLQNALDRCTEKSCDEQHRKLIQDLLKREKQAELRAINDLAYYIGDSIARGVSAAKGYQGRAEDYVDELYRSLSEARNLEERNEFLDTYAYVSIVLESQRANPDTDKFRKMFAQLQKVAEYFETTARTTKVEDAFKQYNMELVRAHLAAARQLAEE